MFEYNVDWNMITKCGPYRAVYCPDHPHAWPNGYVYVHRIVMEWMIGRLLLQSEIVHHKNEIKHDNSPHNLELKANHTEHAACHKRGITMISSECLYCHSTFSRRKGKTVRYCSRRCNGKAQMDIQIKNGMHPKNGNKVWEHGTVVGYRYHKCRCNLCREASTNASREWRTKQI